MTEENKFEPAPRSDASNDDDNEDNFDAANHEADPSDLNNEPVEEQKKSDTRPIEKKVPVLRLDLLASHVPPVQKQVASAKATHHHRNRSIGENPFIARDSATVQSTTESNETPQPQYETLAEFTKENLIKYQADGVTDSAPGENTADFDNSEEDMERARAEEDGQSVGENDSDRPPEVTNVNGSAFFTRDYRVL